MDEKHTQESLENENVEELHSLEHPETALGPGDKATPSTAPASSSENSQELVQESQTTPSPSPAVTDMHAEQKSKFKGRIRNFTARFNIYLLLFILIIIIAVAVIIIAALQARKSGKPAATIGNQSLSQSALQQLSNSDASVGTAKQTLNVQSNAVFAGQVLIRSNLEVAGTIKTGGALSLPGVSVSGNSTLAQAQIGTLAVGDNAAIQGNLTIQRNLTVNGSGSFGSLSAQQLSVGGLQLNGDLILTHHIIAGGPIPKKTDGNALGAGGTSSLSGSDSAGTITINTGSGPAAGCFVAITFAQKLNSTPRVILTPSSSPAAGLPYYVTRTSTSFSVCTATPAPANQNISFDYAIFG